MTMDTSYLFWVPPLIVAAATLYVFYRNQVLHQIEKRLSEFYAPLYLYALRGLPDEGMFWQQLSNEEKNDFFKIMLTRNHLASNVLLELMISDMFSELPDAFMDEKIRVEFQRRVIKDYEDLREKYTTARHWFLPN